MSTPSDEPTSVDSMQPEVKIEPPSITYVATDGACSKNGQINSTASYSFVIATDKEIAALRSELAKQSPTKKNIQQCLADFKCIEESGIIESRIDGPLATNNRGELTGIKMALEFIAEHKISGRIIWISDSEYSQKSVDIWCRKWRKSPAIMSSKLNLDLILPINDAIDNLRKKQIFDLVHVRSHKVMPEDIQSDAWLHWMLNDRADVCCQRTLRL